MFLRLPPGQSSLQEKEVLLTCISSNTAVVANIYDLGIITGSVKQWTQTDMPVNGLKNKSEVISCKGIL